MKPKFICADDVYMQKLSSSFISGLQSHMLEPRCPSELSLSTTRVTHTQLRAYAHVPMCRIIHAS